MKIQLLNNIQCAFTGIKFFKGRTYQAEPAINQPRAMRLIKNQTSLQINKVFIKRDKNSILADKNDFKIVSFPELKTLLFNYKQSKIHIPREKLIVPRGFALREGYRPFKNEKEQTNKLFRCDMGLADGERCNRETVYVKVINPRLKVARCLKCASFRTDR